MSVTALSCISLSTVMCLSQYYHVCHASVIPVSYMRVPQTDGAICWCAAESICTDKTHSGHFISVTLETAHLLQQQARARSMVKLWWESLTGGELMMSLIRLEKKKRKSVNHSYLSNNKSIQVCSQF